METFALRLRKFMQDNNMNQSQLATALGYKSSEKISRLLRDDKASPSVDIILDFSNTFEKLSIEWLLTGKGDIEREKSLDDEKNEMIALQKGMISLQQNLIKRLQQQVRTLGGMPVE